MKIHAYTILMVLTVLLIYTNASQNDTLHLADIFLAKACTEGDLEMVSKLSQLQQQKDGVDINLVNQRYAHGLTPIWIAAQNGHLQIVQFLKENGADVNVANKDGVTPVHISSQNGYFKIVEYLIQNGAHFETKRIDGATPILSSAQNGHLQIVKFLADSGANIDEVDNYGTSPIFRASKNNYLSIVKLLVEKQANINQSSKNGGTPLGVAISYQRKEIAKFLLQKNADMEASKLYLNNNGQSQFIENLERLYEELQAKNDEENEATNISKE